MSDGNVKLFRRLIFAYVSVYTQRGSQQHLCYTGSPVLIFLPAACQHQRDHEKIRNLRASMRDLGMIKRLTVIRCCYRDKLINPVRSMVLVPLNKCPAKKFYIGKLNKGVMAGFVTLYSF